MENPLTVWVLIRAAMYFGETDRIIGVYATEEAAEQARIALGSYRGEVEEFEVKQ